MCALANPADRRVSNCGTEDADHGDADGPEALGGCNRWVNGAEDGCGVGEGWNVGDAICERRCCAVRGKERCRPSY